jgi:hypothetical protein
LTPGSWFLVNGEAGAVRSETDLAEAPDTTRPGNARVQRLLAVAVVGGLLVATGAAFVVTERLKLEKSPIAGTRLTKTFSPVCACASDSASILFRLRHGGSVDVDVINPAGVVVRQLARSRFPAGWMSLRWSGRNVFGRVSPDGDYRIRVHLPAQHRTIVFPNVIVLDTTAPKVKQFRVTRKTIQVGERTRIDYSFSKGAHPVVFVDGREAVYGRFAHTTGTLDWFGKVKGLPVRPGIHRISLAARDDAGNSSPKTGGLEVRVRAPIHRPSRRRRAKH